MNSLLTLRALAHVMAVSACCALLACGTDAPPSPEPADAGEPADAAPPIDSSAPVEAGLPAPRDSGERFVDAASDGAAQVDEPAQDASREGGAQDASAPADASDASSRCAVSEACDGVDNDCNGVVDDFCVPFSVTDFDVDGAGAAVAIGTPNQRVNMACWRADGSVLRPTFEVGGAESNHANAKLMGVDVARSRVRGNIVVTFAYSNFPTAPGDWRVYAAFYDDQCQLVRAPFALDDDIARQPNATTVVRLASAFVSDDGRSYLLHEHQTAQRYRVLVFDTSGTRIHTVDIPSEADCAGGARTRVLALERSSGNFAVLCERSAGRGYRRFASDGTPQDPSFLDVAGSKPVGFAFHEFGGALNAQGTLLYFGRVDATRSILRTFVPAPGASSEVAGRSGTSSPSARVTSTGEFLIELKTDSYALAHVRADTSIARTWPTSPGLFELDAQDNVYVVDNQRIARSTTITVK